MRNLTFEMKPKKELLKQIHDRHLLLYSFYHKHVKEKVRLDITQREVEPWI